MVLARVTHRSVRSMLAAGLALALGAVPLVGEAQDFKRGDANGDGCLGWQDLDAVQSAVLGLSVLDCLDAGDFNDDGLLNILDVFSLSSYLAFDGPPPGGFRPPGHWDCGPDPTADVLTCGSYTGCGRCAPSDCSIVDNGSGTINLPPATCQYLTPQELHMALDGLPPGSSIEVHVIHGAFSDPNEPVAQDAAGAAVTAGGDLGGEVEVFDSKIQVELIGTGSLAGYREIFDVFAPTEVHSAPRTAGDPVQTFATKLKGLEGTGSSAAIQTLRITAGETHGLPSAGETTLVQNGPDFDVASQFDVQYRIEIAGAPGGVLDGVSGSTVGTATMATVQPEPIPVISSWWAAVTGIAVLLGLVGFSRSRAGSSEARNPFASN